MCVGWWFTGHAHAQRNALGVLGLLGCIGVGGEYYARKFKMVSATDYHAMHQSRIDILEQAAGAQAEEEDA